MANLEKERVGLSKAMKDGHIATIIKYRYSIDMDVKWEDNTITEHCRWKDFNKGTLHKIPHSCWTEKNIMDHLGNSYSSTSAMCKAYNIRLDTFKRRIKYGWPLEMALSSPAKKTAKQVEYYSSVRSLTNKPQINQQTLYSQSKVCEDHLGKTYNSVKEMCEAWNMQPKTYLTRIRNGWTIEKALTTPIRTYKKYNIDGESFASLEKACEYYNIPSAVVNRRLKKGWDLKTALNTPPQKQGLIEDHLGNLYPSKMKMCEAYGITLTIYNKRKKKGLTKEEILTTPRHSNSIKDHTGKEWSSIPQMCSYYGITRNMFYARRKRGWDIEKSLTSARKHTLPEEYIGNKKQMANGLWAEIVDYLPISERKSERKFIIKFEDGEYSKRNLNNFVKGKVSHPFLKTRRKCEYKGFEVTKPQKLYGTYYYKCTCKTCGKEDILTPQDMIAGCKYCKGE